MPLPLFISLAYSPWSEKARWALDHHRIRYTPVAFQPLLDEPRLRLRMHKLRGRLSVPLLFDGERWIEDSFAIAAWAESHGSAPHLFPTGERPAIERFNQLSERGLEAGRALGLDRLLRDPEALADLVPRPLRARLGPLAPRIAALGIRRTIRKYRADALPLAEHHRRLAAVLDDLRAALAAAPAPVHGPPTLLGRFTYADITAAQILQFVAPRDLGGFRLRPAGQRCYRVEDLARDYADLIAWRDALYAAHRPPPAT